MILLSLSVSSLKTRSLACFAVTSYVWAASTTFKMQRVTTHVLGRENDIANIHTQDLASGYHVFARWTPPKQGQTEIMCFAVVGLPLLPCLKIPRKNMMLRASSAYKYLSNLGGFSSSLLMRTTLPRKHSGNLHVAASSASTTCQNLFWLWRCVDVCARTCLPPLFSKLATGRYMDFPSISFQITRDRGNHNYFVLFNGINISKQDPIVTRLWLNACWAV